MGSAYWWVQPPPVKDYTVSFQVPPTLAFTGFPDAQTRASNGGTDYAIRGNLTLNITLPDGKKIEGAGEELRVTARDGRFRELTITYRPTTPVPLLEYWKEGRRVAQSSTEESVLVDRGLYSVEAQAIKSEGYCSGYRLRIEAPPAR